MGCWNSSLPVSAPATTSSARISASTGELPARPRARLRRQGARNLDSTKPGAAPCEATDEATRPTHPFPDRAAKPAIHGEAVPAHGRNPLALRARRSIDDKILLISATDRPKEPTYAAIPPQRAGSMTRRLADRAGGTAPLGRSWAPDGAVEATATLSRSYPSRPRTASSARTADVRWLRDYQGPVPPSACT